MKRRTLLVVGNMTFFVVVFLISISLNRMFPPFKSTLATESKQTDISLPVSHKDGLDWISLNQWVAAFRGTLVYDSIEGTIDANITGNQLSFIRDTPQFRLNGIYFPTKVSPWIDSAGGIWIPLKYIEQTYGVKINKKSNNIVVIDRSLSSKVRAANAPMLTKKEAKDWINYLSFLDSPIFHAKVSTKDSHLPGAPRSYRNGFHEGLDWYSGYTGVHIDETIPVRAMADGIVVRATTDYKELTQNERENILIRASMLPRIPQDLLDKLRGRSVWVQYPGGVLARYAHLSKIQEGIESGKKLKRGEILGFVGNSGTSDGARGNQKGLHLHMDLLVYGQLIWESMPADEVRTILEGVFNK